jgi:gliding motility-associated-like protein
MKKIFIILCQILFLAVFNMNSQQKFCADSSIRVKYILPGNFFALFNNPDTSGKNIFTGTYWNAAQPVLGLMAMKTNWGDSIYWAKKYYSDNNIYLGCKNSYKAPGGTLVLTGERRYFNTRTFLISRIDTNGNMLWTRHFPRVTGNSNYQINPNYEPKNIFVSNNAIYFSLYLGWDIVCKLDLFGNLLWSRGFVSGSPPFSTTSNIADGLFEKNGVVYFASTVEKRDPLGSTISVGTVTTQLSDADGSLIKSTYFNIVPDNYAKGFVTRYLYHHKDGSFSLTGYIGINADPTSTNIAPQPNTRFNIRIGADLNPLPAYYYSSNIDPDPTFQYDMNSEKQIIFQYNKVASADKYFISFDSTQQLLRCRKFAVTTNPFSGGSGINLDDKENVHFVYSYSLNGQNTTEYARLSDLAPANTLQCFGIDTASIFQRFPLNLTQEPYTWPFMDNNLINSIPVTIYTEDAVINKEVVCKQVSYCDSLKIRGNTSACVSGADMRYSMYLNPQCLKSVNWHADTAFCTVVLREADSAVTMRFKKAGQFYLKAFVNNCVVADSLLITVSNPQTSLQLEKDSTQLCPGRSITLNVNNDFATYSWQDGSTQNYYTVTTPGLYTITAADSCGNLFTDSVRIMAADTSLSVTANHSICPYDTATMLLPSVVYNISWQPSATGALSGNRLLLYPLKTTTYTLQIMKPPGCDVQKAITVEVKNCPEWVRVPSAFTPNNDGLNDLLRPSVSGHLVSYTIKIFDRYGQQLFSSNNPYTGWNGTYKGAQQNSGLFVYMCRYRFINGKEKLIKGTIMLVR